MAKTTVAAERHPIQLLHLTVRELTIRTHGSIPSQEEVNSANYSLMIATSLYNEADHIFRVLVKVETGMGDDGVQTQSPFSLRVEIAGDFHVDEKRFDRKHVEDFARHNAPFILYPYLREQVYGLTARAGFPPALLDLLELPTYVPATERKAAAVRKKAASKGKRA